ncbi:metallophosphoesterase [Vagococcus acidifermentans]|uniref:Serine/threonine protein phosphatase n=1 Tax=Vagococcus acidifermentans TaxID=564710 RepID=A0A430AWW1_9ENTE|nr:metallophosphoesterase [Vagococcus acidifermentans]RSU12535.1 serine/threonine protein phosphatase [Vagococcus acidifermentans]
MSKLLFVISDVHGNLSLFNELLKDYDQKMHQLVLIGDLLDRGPQSKACLLLGKQLVEETGAVYLMGNHERMFLDFLAKPELMYPNYHFNGGDSTLNSLLHPGAAAEYSPTEMALMIRSAYKELIAFLSSLPLYYEWHDYVCVHAGVNLELNDWRHSSARDFVWIREPFHSGENRTGKVIIFGHTITPSLHGDNVTTDLWLQDNKIGIDGGAVYGGSMHGVIFDDKGIVQDIEVQNNFSPWRPDF